MRGWRLVGKSCELTELLPEDAMVLFTCSSDGTGVRNDGIPLRGRVVNGYYYPHCALRDAVHDDYVWVATAIGEECFK